MYWVAPDVGKVGFMVGSVAYAGHYEYRRKRVDPSLGRSPINGRARDRRSTADEMIVVHNHHEPYVTPAQWDEIERLRRNNAPLRHRRNPGPGGAILQGILRCAAHPSRGMIPRCKLLDNGKRCHSYSCMGDVVRGGRLCPSVSGAGLDKAVAAAVNERVARPRLEAIRQAWRTVRAEAAAEDRRRHLEFERLRRTVADFDRRYMLVDPANRIVAADLEAKLENAMRLLNAAEAAPRPAGAEATFSEDAFAEVAELCADFDRLWNAETTEPRDKKEILRTLIKHVLLERSGPNELLLRIVWADDETETPIIVRHSAYGARRAAALQAQGSDLTQILARLQAEQLVTGQGKPWDRAKVSTLLWRLRNKEGIRARKRLYAKRRQDEGRAGENQPE